jgi:KAP family P-loop domain
VASMSAAAANPLRLWPDNPTPLDLLGFGDIAAPVLEAIERERLDPVAVGVFGDWGSGKTTVLEILNEQLAAAKETIVVYTRPWEYDPTLDVRATLITEVLEAVRERAEKETAFWEKTKDKFAELAKRIKWSKAITLASKSAVTLTLPSPEKLLEIFGDKEEVADPTLQGFRAEFAELMGEFEKVRRVVVLVDDLDRCLPESVVGALEAIKLFLSVEKMAFVVAADEALVKSAIARHFDPSQQGGRMAGDYLEKIIQIPVTVPALGQGDTEAYLAMMLLDQHLDGDETALRAIASHCAERRQQGKPDVFREMPAGLLPEAAADDLALAGELAPVLFEKLDGNPRRLKRFLNAFWVRSDIAARRGVALSPRTLAKLMVLERIEEDAFGQLLDWLGAGTLVENLRKLEDGEQLEEAPHGAFAWWTEMAPKLASADLAPYLRLAAALRRRSGPRTDLRADLAELLDKLGTDVLPERTAAQDKLGELAESDRRTMAREITEAIRLDPGLQVPLSEALTQLLREGLFTSEIVDGLQRLDASRVEAALILAIADEDPVPDEIRAVIRTWRETTRLNMIAKNAADEVLGGTA